MKTARTKAAAETKHRLNQIEELVGILSRNDLTAEERKDYSECVEIAYAWLQKAQAA